MVLKFHIQIPHEKKLTHIFFHVQVTHLFGVMPLIKQNLKILCARYLKKYLS